MVIILKCLQLSNHYFVHLKLIMLYVCCTSINNKQKKSQDILLNICIAKYVWVNMYVSDLNTVLGKCADSRMCRQCPVVLLEGWIKLISIIFLHLKKKDNDFYYTCFLHLWKLIYIYSSFTLSMLWFTSIDVFACDPILNPRDKPYYLISYYLLYKLLGLIW